MDKQDTQIKYDKPEDLPSLRKGWVRLVHRCIAKSISGPDNIESIKQNGLVFNRQAADIAPHARGGTYRHITEMASIYTEEDFWQSMKKDDFACYNDARYADTKLVFDMPIDEFVFLQRFGRRIKGTIDSKYLVGVIKNVNGANKNLSMPLPEVNKAAYRSMKNPPSQAEPNNVENLIEELLQKHPAAQRETVLKYLADEKRHITDELYPAQTSAPKVQKTYPQQKTSSQIR